jgi:integrase
MTNETVKRKPGRPPGTSKGRDPLAFSEEELKKFLDVTKRDKRSHVLFGLAYYLGLRVVELVEIKLSDISLEGVFVGITIQGAKHGFKKSYSLPEFLSKMVRSYIRSLPKNSHWLFPSPKWPESHLARETAQALFKRLRDKAGLDKKFSIHSLRHTTAMMKVRAGDSPVMIQDWLRQKSLMSAMNYFRVGENNEYGARVAERDNELFR